MIQKLLCWLFGHKIVFKAATGDVLVADSAFDRDKKYPLVTLERSKFCLRCGITIREVGERVLTVLNIHIPECGKPPGLETTGRCYTAYFENEECEQLVFRYDYELKRGTLWHGDYNWEHPLEVQNGCAPITLGEEEDLWLQLVWKVATRE